MVTQKGLSNLWGFSISRTIRRKGVRDATFDLGVEVVRAIDISGALVMFVKFTLPARADATCSVLVKLDLPVQCIERGIPSSANQATTASSLVCANCSVLLASCSSKSAEYGPGASGIDLAQGVKKRHGEL